MRETEAKVIEAARRWRQGFWPADAYGDAYGLVAAVDALDAEQPAWTQDEMRAKRQELRDTGRCVVPTIGAAVWVLMGMPAAERLQYTKHVSPSAVEIVRTDADQAQPAPQTCVHCGAPMARMEALHCVKRGETELPGDALVRAEKAQGARLMVSDIIESIARERGHPLPADVCDEIERGVLELGGKPAPSDDAELPDNWYPGPTPPKRVRHYRLVPADGQPAPSDDDVEALARVLCESSGYHTSSLQPAGATLVPVAWEDAPDGLRDYFRHQVRAALGAIGGREAALEAALNTVKAECDIYVGAHHGGCMCGACASWRNADAALALPPSAAAGAVRELVEAVNTHPHLCSECTCDLCQRVRAALKPFVGKGDA